MHWMLIILLNLSNPEQTIPFPSTLYEVEEECHRAGVMYTTGTKDLDYICMEIK